MQSLTRIRIDCGEKRRILFVQKVLIERDLSFVFWLGLRQSVLR
jgi:hypothetical protein